MTNDLFQGQGLWFESTIELKFSPSSQRYRVKNIVRCIKMATLKRKEILLSIIYNTIFRNEFICIKGKRCTAKKTQVQIALQNWSYGTKYGFVAKKYSGRPGLLANMSDYKRVQHRLSPTKPVTVPQHSPLLHTNPAQKNIANKKKEIYSQNKQTISWLRAFNLSRVARSRARSLYLECYKLHYTPNLVAALVLVRNTCRNIWQKQILLMSIFTFLNKHKRNDLLQLWCYSNKIKLVGSDCGVFGWLAALTNCWNIFLSFMGSIPVERRQ